jgi:membrane protein DedA with SNARE-associated domain
MPEDIVLITGGILASHGVTDFWMVNVVCMAGVLIGDGIVFTLGRRFGPSIKSKGIFKRIFNEKRDAQVRTVFDKYGDKVIFMGRFMPGLRTPIFLSAGVYQVPPWKFFALDGLAAIISVPLWIWVGYFFGQNMAALEHKIKQFQFGIYAALGALIIVFFASKLLKKNIVSSPT